jgi:hypothetical protein
MNNNGIRKIPKTEAAIMPPNTGVPTAWRVAAPAPCAMTRGKSPKMKAKLVIITGRNRKLAASMAAATMSLPCSRCSTANATIRMPFLAASAISTTNPICA